jgi:hypothetical protein
MFIKVSAVAVSRTRSNCRSLICLSLMIFSLSEAHVCSHSWCIGERVNAAYIGVGESVWSDQPGSLHPLSFWLQYHHGQVAVSWLQFSMLLRIVLAMISQSSHPLTIWVSQFQQVYSHHGLQFRFSKFATRMCNHTDSPFSIYSQFLNWQQEAISSRSGAPILIISWILNTAWQCPQKFLRIVFLFYLYELKFKLKFFLKLLYSSSSWQLQI